MLERNIYLFFEWKRQLETHRSPLRMASAVEPQTSSISGKRKRTLLPKVGTGRERAHGWVEAAGPGCNGATPSQRARVSTGRDARHVTQSLYGPHRRGEQQPSLPAERILASGRSGPSQTRPSPNAATRCRVQQWEGRRGRGRGGERGEERKGEERRGIRRHHRSKHCARLLKLLGGGGDRGPNVEAHSWMQAGMPCCGCHFEKSE